MKPIVISLPDFFPDEIKILKNLFEAGLTRFHLRKPNASKNDLRKFLENFNEKDLQKIIVHGYHDLPKEFPIGGIHFREKVREERNANQQSFMPMYSIKGNEDSFTVSTSVHDFSSLEKLSIEFDYTFISPVFNSISKKGYSSNLQLQHPVGERRMNIQLIALGGIAANNISLVKKWGYDGAAVLGAVWSNPQKAVSTFSKIQQAWQEPVHTS